MGHILTAPVFISDVVYNIKQRMRRGREITLRRQQHKRRESINNRDSINRDTRECRGGNIIGTDNNTSTTNINTNCINTTNINTNCTNGISLSDIPASPELLSDSFIPSSYPVSMHIRELVLVWIVSIIYTGIGGYMFTLGNIGTHIGTTKDITIGTSDISSDIPSNISVYWDIPLLFRVFTENKRNIFEQLFVGAVSSIVLGMITIQ